MPNFLEEKKREIAQRLEELRPAVEEYQQLEGALAALGGVSGGVKAARAPHVAEGAPARPPVAPAHAAAGARRAAARARPRRWSWSSPTRASPSPGLADRMGIKQNYLYRVLPGLERDGQVRKDGRGWHPKKAA